MFVPDCKHNENQLCNGGCIFHCCARRKGSKRFLCQNAFVLRTKNQPSAREQNLRECRENQISFFSASWTCVTALPHFSQKCSQLPFVHALKTLQGQKCNSTSERYNLRLSSKRHNNSEGLYTVQVSLVGLDQTTILELCISFYSVN